MNSTTVDDAAGREAAYDASPATADRYGELSIQGGDLVVFDREVTEAWLQCDRAVDVRA